MDGTAIQGVVTYPQVLFQTVVSGHLETNWRVLQRAILAGRILHLSETELIKTQSQRLLLLSSIIMLNVALQQSIACLIGKFTCVDVTQKRSY